MQIKSIEVKNLRALKSVSLSFESLTALLGANNAGKSSILKSIDLFFEASPKITREDFCSLGDAEQIEITLTFHRLTAGEVVEFSTAVIEGEVTISRLLSLDANESGHYSVLAKTFSGFDEIRDETNGTKKRSLYNKIRAEYELPEIATFNDIPAAFQAWENANPAKLESKKVRGFFGAINVANGKLKKKTGVHLVPAVRDVAVETADPKRGAVISLLADVARQTFENRKDIAEFIEGAKKKFSELADPEKVPQLSGISSLLTASIQKFYADSKLSALWEPGEGVSVTYPSARLVVDHGGVTTDLSRVGHGLQRAAVFSIVQFLAEQRSNNDIAGEFPEAASDIILLVEEPEIYQHPAKQLVIYDAFKNITGGHNKATGIRVQIIYTTHSEKFVRMSDFNIARIVRRSLGDAPVNSVSELSLSRCSDAFSKFFVPPRNAMSDEAFAAKLHIFSREVCEGFFAEKVILVEGVTDKAILEAAYRVANRDIHQEALSIISMDGKTKLDKPAYIFWQLGIPCFLAFDNDAGKKEEKKAGTNRLLQKICDVAEPEDYPEGCTDRFCSFGGTIERFIKERLGNEHYEKVFNEVSDEFGLDYDDLKKTPAALTEVFLRALALGVEFPLINDIVQKVDLLKIDH